MDMRPCTQIRSISRLFLLQDFLHAGYIDGFTPLFTGNQSAYEYTANDVLRFLHQAKRQNKRLKFYELETAIRHVN